MSGGEKIGCLTGALLHHHTTGLETLTGLNKHCMSKTVCINTYMEIQVHTVHELHIPVNAVFKGRGQIHSDTQKTAKGIHRHTDDTR